MNIRRRKDPLGIAPDRVGIKLNAGDSAAEIAAVREYLEARSTPARLQRLHRHADLADAVHDLERRYDSDGATDVFLIDLGALESKADRLDALPRLVRDQQRQSATQGPRRGQMPLMDMWLAARLREKRQYTNNDLWALLPNAEDEISGNGEARMYRDGAVVVEVSEHGRPHEIGRKAFNERVRKARPR